MPKKETAKEKEVDFDDASVRDALHQGNNALLPAGVTIRSPYGKVRDVAARDEATGDDGNDGSDRT